METFYAADADDLIAASRTSRFLALAVDLVLILALTAAIFRFQQLQTFESGSRAMVTTYALTLMAAVSALFAQVYLLVVFGQTIGKRAMGIRVIIPEGFVPPLLRIVFRRLLPMVALLLLVEGVLKLRYAGVLVVLADALPILLPQRRCLHDLLADTHVVRA